MNFKPFLNAIPYLCVGLLFVTAFWGAIDILATISSNIESWLRAKRNINTEVPALAASVKELREQQSRLEREMEQIRRAGTTSGPVVR
jgi:peptidoglycan hydrolase CwlO-like protein